MNFVLHIENSVNFDVLEMWKFDVLQLATVSHHLDPRKLF